MTCCGRKSVTKPEDKPAARASEKRTLLGVELADSDTVKKRLAICVGCEHFRSFPIMRCAECGCALSAKARIKNGACPIGKW